MANEKIEDVIKKVILGENFLAENADSTDHEQVDEEAIEEEYEEIEEAKKGEEDEESEDEDEEDEEEDAKEVKEYAEMQPTGMTSTHSSPSASGPVKKKKPMAFNRKPSKMAEAASDYASPKIYMTANKKSAEVFAPTVDSNSKNLATIKPKKSDANGKVEKPKASVKESVETLFAGKDLSEEFKTEVGTLFEAHLATRTQEIEEELQAKYSTLLEEHTLAVTEEMVGRIDEYLNYVVEEWMQENRLAVEQGLRTEITEGFIEKLRGIFAESYIEIPEEKLDLFESTVEDFENLKGELDEQVSKNMEINEENEQLRCELLFREIAEGLTDTETQKLRDLAESVEFDSVEQFAEKLAVLRENIESFSGFSITETSNEESIEESYEEESEASPLMEAYIKSMSRSND